MEYFISHNNLKSAILTIGTISQRHYIMLRVYSSKQKNHFGRNNIKSENSLGTHKDGKREN